MLQKSNIQQKLKDINIRVPKFAVIGTDEFDRFMKNNNLWYQVLNSNLKTNLEKLFLKSRLSIDLILKLESFIKENKYPIAVRSSSLLEDSQYQPLAGTYDTYMLSNNSRSDKKRLKELINAIKMVYASTFKGDAKSLLDNTGHRIEEEKMAILIQEIVGQPYKSKRFYPTFSGLLQSINYYPVSYMKRSEGVAYLALGFGRTIVDGEKCLRISPKYPTILPEFYSIKETLRNSQNQFYGLALKKKDQKESDLSSYTLNDAEEDGALKWLGSVISKDDGMIRDSLSKDGSRIVSFAPILKWNTIPFTSLAKKIISLCTKSLGCPVEIEFAVNIYDDDKPEFCLLQIKPMIMTGLKRVINSNKLESSSIFCKSNVTLGDGTFNNIYDLVLVRLESFDIGKTKEIASEISIINRKFKNKNKYILCGPGRWGSADSWLGIPVQWQEISNAKAIVEIGSEDLPIDPSFGSHFFQNITSLHIPYFTINLKKKNDHLDLDWINKDSAHYKGKYTDWFHFKNPLRITVDGSIGLGIISQPIIPNYKSMSEKDSTGI